MIFIGISMGPLRLEPITLLQTTDQHDQFRIKEKPIYTRRQINLYRMFFDDFAVNSQPIFIRTIFARTIFELRCDYREIFIKKYYVIQKLDHLTCSKFEIMTSLLKPIKLVKLS